MPRADGNTFQISAYGEKADRDRLFLVAEAEGVSQSQWIINKLRVAYQDLYGPEHPTKILHRGGASILKGEGDGPPIEAEELESASV